MRLIRAGLTIALATLACDAPTSSATGISIRLEATPTVAQTGDTVTFTVNVIANRVSDVVIDYGDSNGDQYSAGGVAVASVTFKHAYANTGSFMSRATVSDAVVGSRVVTQLIVVNPRTEPPPQ